MHVVILGCGRVGATLARSFDKEGHTVAIIDQQSDAFKRLGSSYTGVTIVGNGIDEEVLIKAGIQQADAFVAVTNGDNTNLMSVQIARERFHIEKAITRIKDPIRACAYRDLGIETICTTLIASRLLKDYLTGTEWRTTEEYCALNEDEVFV